MPEFTGEETVFDGSYGHSTKLNVTTEEIFVATVAHWLITHPQGHPMWSQYMLLGLRLEPFPNMPDPVLHFPEANRSIIVAALNPDSGPYTPEIVAEYADTKSPKFGSLPFLTPITIEWQFTGTDDECNKLVTASAWALTEGVLWPESADAPTRIRSEWRTSLEKTLKHIRGEAHER